MRPRQTFERWHVCQRDTVIGKVSVSFAVGTDRAGVAGTGGGRSEGRRCGDGVYGLADIVLEVLPQSDRKDDRATSTGGCSLNTTWPLLCP